MKPTTKPSPSARRYPVCPAAVRYEQLKAELRDKALSPAEYERAILEAARRAGL